jgi:hypothetical protein
MGAPGRELPQPIEVIVTDDENSPIQDVVVTFTAGDGSGSVSAPEARSDVQGRAQVSWILGGEPGTQTVEAAATDESGSPLDGSPLTISAQAVRPPPASMLILQGPQEAARNGVPFEQQPIVEVLDSESQPVPDIEVLASIAAGGGALSGTTTVASDAAGRVTYTNLAILGTSGPRTIRFSVADPALEVISGTIQVSAGTPVAMAGIGPFTYEGTVNSPVSPAPSVVVRDEAGNGVPGVSVTFTPNRNGSVSPETATTNEQGIAQVSWTLGSTANVQYTLTARIESSAIPTVRFSAMARAGAAGRLRVEVEPSSPTQSGTPFAQQPAIQVVDQAGNPTPQGGLTVTAAVSAGPTGVLQNASAITDAAGRAVFSGLTLTGIVGNYAISFSAPGLTGVTSDPITLTVGPAARLAFTVVPSTLARSRMPLVIQPVLQIQDASGNPVAQAGTQVVASASPAGTTLTGETATTEQNGRAAFAGLAITGIPGPKVLTFSAPQLQSVTAQVTLPSVANVTVTAAHPESVLVGTTLTTPVSWTLTDAIPRPVPDADFILSASSGGTVAPNPTTSDANGTVQLASWTLGTTAGDQYVELKLPDGRIFRDSIVAVPDVADTLVKISGDQQTAPPNSSLAEPLVVQVTDQHGNGVGGVIVQWRACDGTGDYTPVTDNDGFSSAGQPTGPESGDNFCTQASASRTDGTPLRGSPVTFTYSVSSPTPSASQTRTGEPGLIEPRGLPPVAPKSPAVRRSTSR